jgi:hypothetical protein
LFQVFPLESKLLDPGLKERSDDSEDLEPWTYHTRVQDSPTKVKTLQDSFVGVVLLHGTILAYFFVILVIWVSGIWGTSPWVVQGVQDLGVCYQMLHGNKTI